MAKRTHGGPRKRGYGGTKYSEESDTRKPKLTQLTPEQNQRREFELRMREEDALRQQLMAQIESDYSFFNPIQALKLRSPKGKAEYEPRGSRQYKDAQIATQDALVRSGLSREEEQRMRNRLRQKRGGAT